MADDVLTRGRGSYQRRAWAEAFSLLTSADRDAALGVEDLERLATAAYLIGRDGDSVKAWTRAHHECLRLDDPTGAARYALWLAFELFNKGDEAQGGGWLARAQRSWTKPIGIASSVASS